MKIFLSIVISLMFVSCVKAHEPETMLLVSSATKSIIRGDVAVYNLSNAKLHKKDCEWADKCVKNCIVVGRKELKNIFYVPCMVCGGEAFVPVELDGE